MWLNYSKRNRQRTNNGDISQLHTSYTNILESLAGEEVLKFDEEIKGNLLVAAYNSSSFVEK